MAAGIDEHLYLILQAEGRKHTKNAVGLLEPQNLPPLTHRLQQDYTS